MEQLAVVGHRALARADMPAASSLLGRAAELAPPGVQKARLLIDLGFALVQSGELSTADETLATAIEVAAAAQSRDLVEEARIEREFLRAQTHPGVRSNSLQSKAASDSEATGGRSIPRQAKFGYSLRMTRNKPTPGACATVVAAVSRPTGCAPRVTESMRTLPPGLRRFERLAEVQQGVGAHERVSRLPRARRGSRDRRFARPALSVAQAVEKLRPILRRFRAQGESVGSGRGKLFAAACDPAMRSGGAQLRRQLLAQPGGVGENEPRFFRGRFRRRRRRRRVAARPCARAGRSGLRRPRSDQARAAKSSSLKPASRNTRSHCARSEQRLMRTQIAIGEAPPAAGEAEDRFGPQLRRRGVHEDEAAARREQIVQMAAASRARRSPRAAHWCR